MEKTQHKLLTISVEAGAALASAKRFVKMNSGVLAYCGANGKAIGVLELAADSGEMASVITHGVVLVEVGAGGITEGAEITSDASGKAIAVAALSATATGADAVVPSGATPVTSDAATPDLTITQPTIAIAGGTTPVKINGIAMDAGSEGDFARIILK